MTDQAATVSLAQEVPRLEADGPQEEDAYVTTSLVINTTTDGANEDDMFSPAHMSASAITSPPYWVNTNYRQRSASDISGESALPAGAIRLCDNETDRENDRNNACWARSVEILDHTVVNGGATAIGAFVVWNIKVEALNVRGLNLSYQDPMQANNWRTGELYQHS